MVELHGAASDVVATREQECAILALALRLTGSAFAMGDGDPSGKSTFLARSIMSAIAVYIILILLIWSLSRRSAGPFAIFFGR